MRFRQYFLNDLLQGDLNIFFLYGEQNWEHVSLVVSTVFFFYFLLIRLRTAHHFILAVQSSFHLSYIHFYFLFGVVYNRLFPGF